MKYILAILFLTIHSGVSQNETVDYYNSGDYNDTLSKSLGALYMENTTILEDTTMPKESQVAVLNISNDGVLGLSFNNIEQYLLVGNNTISEVFTEQNIWIVLGVLGFIFACVVLVVYFFH